MLPLVGAAVGCAPGAAGGGALLPLVGAAVGVGCAPGAGGGLGKLVGAVVGVGCTAGAPGGGALPPLAGAAVGVAGGTPGACGGVNCFSVGADVAGGGTKGLPVGGGMAEPFVGAAPSGAPTRTSWQSRSGVPTSAATWVAGPWPATPGPTMLRTGVPFTLYSVMLSESCAAGPSPAKPLAV